MLMQKKQNPGLEYEDSAEPGIWYLIWLEPRWMFCTDIGSKANHYTFWQETMVDSIAKHYCIGDPEKIKDLMCLHKSMPRGRVTVDGYGEKYAVLHGDDFPPGVKGQTIIDSVISVFGLTSKYFAGVVTIGLHRHETMEPEQQDKIQKIIGSVRY